jgi:pimeloyl-ACP methyl ester carboxylesterase
VQPTIAASNGIEIAYETFGTPDSRPLLLVAGLGAQMLVWHPNLCAALAAEDFFGDCCIEGRRRSACLSACAAAAVFVRSSRPDRRSLASGSRGR